MEQSKCKTREIFITAKLSKRNEKIRKRQYKIFATNNKMKVLNAFLNEKNREEKC